MKNLLLVVLAAVLFSSCDSEEGSGHVITQKRNVGSFKKITASEGSEVEIRKGTSGVSVEADDNIIDLVETDVDGNTLQIGLKDHTSVSNVHIKVYVTAEELTGVNVSSGAEIMSAERMNSTGTVTLEASSAGKITFKVDAPRVDADASSGSEINVTGRTKTVKASGSSGSSVHAFELLSEAAAADASSGAQVDVFASVSVDGSASSGGGVKYKGAAAVVKKDESSGGSVAKEN